MSIRTIFAGIVLAGVIASGAPASERADPGGLSQAQTPPASSKPAQPTGNVCVVIVPGGGHCYVRPAPLRSKCRCAGRPGSVTKTPPPRNQWGF